MLKFAVSVLVLLATTSFASAESCDYFASPDGSGNGLHHSSPFRISDFFEVARPGDTLCLLDGTYEGSASMIEPSRYVLGLSGTPDRPITIRALNDGAVTIDGQHARRPVALYGNSFWVFEGFDVRKGSCTVITLNGRSTNNTFRRIVAYDTDISRNCHVVSAQGSSTNLLFEDFAAFGTGRKMFEMYGGSHNATCRRCWFDHQGDTTGGATGVTLLYLTKHVTLENVLATASGAVQPYQYRDRSGRLRTDHFVHQILGIDRLDESKTPKHGYSKIHGAIVYTKATDFLPARPLIARFSLFGTSSLTVKDVITVMDPAHRNFDEVRGIKLNRRYQNCAVKGATCDDPVVNNVAEHLTSIRGRGGDVVHSDWSVRDYIQGSSLAEVTAQGANPWSGTRGAQMCHRYHNGVLTSAPLWPWPMNSRIRAATGRAGRYTGPCTDCFDRDGDRYVSPVRPAIDVTVDIEDLLGRIPDTCRTNG